jgi:hypothetical protein
MRLTVKMKVKRMKQRSRETSAGKIVKRNERPEGRRNDRKELNLGEGHNLVV